MYVFSKNMYVFSGKHVHVFLKRSDDGLLIYYINDNKMLFNVYSPLTF